MALRCGFPIPLQPRRFSELFRFATSYDYLLIAMGTVGAIIHGGTSYFPIEAANNRHLMAVIVLLPLATMPLFTILFGDILGGFGDSTEFNATAYNVTDGVIVPNAGR